MSTALALHSRGLLRVEEAQQILAECASVEEAREIRDKALAISVYLRQQKAAKDAQADAWEIRYRAETRIGELLNPAQEKRGKQKSLPSDISRNQSSRWQQQARLATDEPTRYVKFIEAERGRIIHGATNRHGTEISSDPNHDGDEWCTRAEMIASVRQVLGDIDLDPASNAWAQEVVRAKRFYTKKQDGLSKPWKGRVYSNPPYTRVTEFTSKLLAEWQAGRVTAAIFFVVSYTNAPWFQRLLREAPVCFLKGRIAFRLEGERSAAGTFQRHGHAVFYLGNQVTKFCKVFGPMGTVMLPAGS